MMIFIGKLVVYSIVFCGAAGAIYAVFYPEKELGKQFLNGIYSIGPIFLSVAGIFASFPYIACFIHKILAPFFHIFGADPSMAATTIIAVDMGGYQLAQILAQTKENWIMAMITGYMSGATLVFSIPVGLNLIQKKDQKYFALGIISGLLTIPIGVFVSSLCIALTKPVIRETITTNGEAAYQLTLQFSQILVNLIPLSLICILITFGLLFIPDSMIKGFTKLGHMMDAAMKLFLAFFIIEHFTGLFSSLFGIWAFEPIIADASDQNRALEIAGYTSLMLSGAFPMVYLIQKYLNKPLNRLGSLFHISPDTIAGSITASANVLALYPMLTHMKAKDKVRTIAFAVCGTFLLGDHLSFTANFQPALIVPLFCGKLSAGCIAVFIADKIAVPKAEKIEKLEHHL